MSILSDTPRSLLRVTSTANVHKVAGAIAHSIRSHGAVDVQAIGANAVNQSVKAIAVARSFLEAEGASLSSQPEMVDLEEDGMLRTAVRFTVRGG